MATSSPRWRALERCASIALSLMLLLLTNNVYAIDGSAHSRFRADVGNVDNGKHHEQPLKRRRAAKAEHVKAHHGGGRGHHRDKTPATSLAALAPEAVLVSESVASSHGSGKSGKEVVAPAETLQEVAIVSESVAVSSGGKSGKVPPVSTVPQSVTSSPGSGKSGKEVIAPTETLTPVAHTEAVSTTALENATVTEGVLTMAAVAPADAENSITTPIIDVSAGGGGNAMPYDSKVGKIYKEEPDADLVKPKASKANHPLTEYFIKESTVPALTKSGKSGKSAGGSSVGDKSSKDATSGKSSKAAALASMSFDFASTGRTIYDLLAANPNFTTLVAAVDAAGLTDVLKVAGPLTVAAPTNEAFDAFATLHAEFYDKLLLPESIKVLQDVLGYHILDGNFPSEYLASGDMPSLSGDPVTVVVSDAGITLNDANVIIPDIIASNGVIHGIDTVLLPPERPGSFPTPTPVVTGPPVALIETIPPVVVVGLPTLPPQQLLTLPPTLLPGSTSPPMLSMTSPYDVYPTYSPTGDSLLRQVSPGGNAIPLRPFGLRLVADSAEASYDEEIVTRVTEEHLIHSFRTKDYEVEGLKLMALVHERRLFSEHAPSVATKPISLRYLNEHPVYELIYGGVLHFPTDAEKTPGEEDMQIIVKESFSGERLSYYVELLQESGIGVSKADLDMNLVPPSGGSSPGTNWAGLAIGLSSALAGIGMLALGSRYMYKRRLSIDDLDLGKKEDYTIRLQYTNDEIDGYPATTAETMSSRDQLSVPRLIQGIEDEVNFQTTPRGKIPFLTGKNRGKGNIKDGSLGGRVGEISPLESPKVASEDASQALSPRYISVFTVKKDCGGKTLDQINLRDLIIAYLTRMMKKLPNTHLLPYDKKSTLPAIINIRNIPDDIAELQHYVGNPHVDDKTGKVMFNLRVEGDQPVSKMKSNASGDGKIGLTNKSRPKSNTVSPITEAARRRKAPESPVGSNTTMEHVESKSPITPASMQDVDL